jgi:hypothetical protein
MNKEIELTPAPAKKPRHVVSAINSLVERREAWRAQHRTDRARPGGVPSGLVQIMDKEKA